MDTIWCAARLLLLLSSLQPALANTAADVEPDDFFDSLKDDVPTTEFEPSHGRPGREDVTLRPRSAGSHEEDHTVASSVQKRAEQTRRWGPAAAAHKVDLTVTASPTLPKYNDTENDRGGNGGFDEVGAMSTASSCVASPCIVGVATRWR